MNNNNNISMGALPDTGANIQNAEAILDLSFLENTVISFLFFIEKFRVEFVQKFPETSKNIESFIGNPQCSCRYSLIEYIKNNDFSIIKFTKEFYDINKELREEMHTYVKQSNFVDASGTIEIVDDTPEAWKQFYRKISDNNYRFRNFQIFKEDGKIKVYFI
jgi:hypothetical protein